MRKFKVGDKVNIPHDDRNMINFGYLTESNGIPENLIIHGNSTLNEDKKFGIVEDYHNEYVIVSFISSKNKKVQLGFYENNLTLIVEKTYTEIDILIDLKIGIIYEKHNNNRINEFLEKCGRKGNIGNYRYYGNITYSIRGTDRAENFSRVMTIDEIENEFFNKQTPKSNGNETHARSENKVRNPIVTIREGQRTEGNIVSSKVRKITIAVGHLSNRTIA